MKFKLVMLSLATLGFMTFTTKPAAIEMEFRKKNQKALNEELIQATVSGNTKTVKNLLEAGADVNGANKYGNTALILAVMYGHTEIVQILLDTPGINVNAANKDGETALIKAARRGNIDMVEALLKDDAEIPEDISRYSDTIKDILEREKIARARRGRFTKSAAKKHAPRKDLTRQEDGTGGA